MSLSTTSGWRQSWQTAGRARPSPSHLECQGAGYEGIQGANLILSRIHSLHSMLNLAYSNLGSAGIIQLLEGLDACKAVFPCSSKGEWGISTLEVRNCNISDLGVDAIMAYCMRDVQMRSINLGQNQIELRTHLTSIMNSINSSNLVSIDLSGNGRLLSSAVSMLFSTLNAPYLSTLNISHCSLPSDVATPIANYLRCKRSWRIRHLNLKGNHFDLQAVREIVDALEFGNFTLQSLDIMPITYTLAVLRPLGIERQLIAEFQHQSDRIDLLFQRNRRLGKRTEIAALRCLPFARILLNAEPSTPPSSDQSSTVYHSTPTEIQHRIIRYTSGDAGALSNGQFSRVMLYAEGKRGMQETLRDRAGARGVHEVKSSDESFGGFTSYTLSEPMLERLFADQWLSSVGLSVWE